jgi:hypothetical protein
MSDMVYLVRAYSTKSENHIWIGGAQSKDIADARYWTCKSEAQVVVDQNQLKFADINDTLEARPGTKYGPRTIRLEVVPMTRKELMVARLKG